MMHRLPRRGRHDSASFRRKQLRPSPWAVATALSDLGELTARWLEGNLAEHPGYLSPPDEETVPLIPSLAALNRAGLVTDFSQPGAAGSHSGGWQQRAAVSGLCSYSTSELLHERLATAELVVFAQRRDAGVRIPVTVVDREPHTWVGAVPPLEDLALLYTGTATGRACELVASGWYVTAFDPIWARNDQLWPALAAALMAAAEDGA